MSREATVQLRRYVRALSTGAALLKPSPGFIEAICSSLLGNGFGGDWSAATLPPELLATAVSETGSRSLLLAAAGSAWHCRDSRVHLGSSTNFIRTGGQDCFEKRTTLAAMIIDHEGRPLWRSRRFDGMAGPVHAPPDTAAGVLSLFEDVPKMRLAPAAFM